MTGPSPAVRAMLDVVSAAFPRLGTDLLDAAEARALLSGGQRRAPRPVAGVADRTVPGGPPVRIYRPSTDEPLPALVFFHGGGFVLCDLDSHDALCRDLAIACGCVVVSVDYRRAPEHRYPAALDDADSATEWVLEQAVTLGIDPLRVGLAGDSAGGNLAAAVGLRRLGRGDHALALQLLMYPMLDPAQDTASYRRYADGYFVTAAHLRWYWDCYRSRPGDDADPGFSPPAAASLSGLPPAVVAVAGLDPLADEGRTYAGRLLADGTPVELIECPGLFHGFAGFGEQLPEAADAFSRIARAARARLHGPAQPCCARK